MNMERAAMKGKLAELQDEKAKLVLKGNGLCTAIRQGLNSALTPFTDMEIPMVAQQMDDLVIDPVQFNVQFKGKSIVLAKKEFELLYLLASKPGRVFLRNEILSQIWGNEVIVGDRTIDVHIRKVRQKLGIDCITTVKGVGYKFEL